jgi:hypothetical protein
MEFRRAFSGSPELDALNKDFQCVQDEMSKAQEGTHEHLVLSARYAELLHEGEALSALLIRNRGGI